MPKFISQKLTQYAGVLCPQTCVNIIKGALHAGIVAGIFAAGDYALQAAQVYQSDNQMVTATLAFAVPFAYNAWREWKKGVPVPPAPTAESVNGTPETTPEEPVTP